MSSNAYKDFIIGTFIAWGLMLKEKWELLALDIDSYNIDVWCHQENKIKGFDINIGVRPHKLTDLETDSQYYHNGFFIDSKWNNNIHKYWTNNYSIQYTYRAPKLIEQSINIHNSL